MRIFGGSLARAVVRLLSLFGWQFTWQGEGYLGGSFSAGGGEVVESIWVAVLLGGGEDIWVAVLAGGGEDIWVVVLAGGGEDIWVAVFSKRF